MNKRKIGSLDVSIVGLGCNNFGPRLDPARTKEVVDAAVDAGINLFDTAPLYGSGKSEEYLGRAIAHCRAEVLIATKFGYPDEAPVSGGSPEYIRRAIDVSLKRLGTDHVDLYQQHKPDPRIPIAETLGALTELVAAGKVREIGCSNFTVQMLRDAAEAAASKQLAQFVSVQNEFSLMHREPESGVLQECERKGMALLPYFPLASGLLTGKYRKGAPVPRGTRIAESKRYNEQLSKENLEVVEKLVRFAEARGHTILELAFSWLLSHSPVASVIAGATSPAQVRSNAAAPVWQLSAAEMQEVSEITPAP
jgi:aryl-alcohol dehydrogenase-like predicted oxidoreductase